MAITRTMRANGQRVAGNPHTLTISAPPNGDLLVCKIALKTGASNSVSSISGVCGTWTKAVAGWQTGSNTRTEIWYGIVTASGTSVTVTLSTSLAITQENESYNFSTGVPLVTALTAEGNGNADNLSDVTIVLTGEDAAGVDVTINPTNATNFVTGMSSIASTAAGTWSGLTAGWTQSAATGGGSSTLHPAYPYWRQNAPTGAQVVQVTRSAAALAGNAIIQISEAVAEAIFERDERQHAIYRM